jgi:hypothetical protein
MPRSKQLEGLEHPDEPAAQLNVRVPKTTIEDVKTIAAEEQRTLASAVDRLLREAIDYWWRERTIN